MAGLPAVCDNGHRYEDRNFFLGPGVTGATFVGSRGGPCPRCGAMASIVDGTYDVVGGVTVRRAVTSAVRFLARPSLSLDDLLTLQRILREAQGRGAEAVTPEEVGDKVEKEAPAASGVLEWMKSPTGVATAEWLNVFIPVLLWLIALLITLKSDDATVSPEQVEQIISETVERTIEGLKDETNTPPTATTATETPTSSVAPRRQRGGEPCACGSKRQFKNCHGRGTRSAR